SLRASDGVLGAARTGKGSVDFAADDLRRCGGEGPGIDAGLLDAVLVGPGVEVDGRVTPGVLVARGLLVDLDDVDAVPECERTGSTVAVVSESPSSGLVTDQSEAGRLHEGREERDAADSSAPCERFQWAFDDRRARRGRRV